MKADLERMCRFVDLIRTHPRIRVSRLQAEMDLPPGSVYRWIRAASTVLPIRLENGVVINESPPTSLSRHDNPTG